MLRVLERWIERRRRLARRPRIGLALGSGSARGIAHVGVLKALTDAGIPIDCIAGTSAGAIIAVIYGATGSVEPMLQEARKISLTSLARPTLSMRGVASSQALEDLVLRLAGDLQFHELKIPVTVVATDLKSGREVLLNTGRIARAARASAGFVGLYTPVEIGGLHLVDGGVALPVPVNVARAMGADIVIAVDVIPRVVLDTYPENMFSIVTRALDILLKQVSRQYLADAEFVIEPIQGDFGSFDYDDAMRTVEAGERAAVEVIPLLRERMAALTALVKVPAMPPVPPAP